MAYGLAAQRSWRWDFFLYYLCCCCCFGVCMYKNSDPCGYFICCCSRRQQKEQSSKTRIMPIPVQYWSVSWKREMKKKTKTGSMQEYNVAVRNSQFFRLYRKPEKKKKKSGFWRWVKLARNLLSANFHRVRFDWIWAFVCQMIFDSVYLCLIEIKWWALCSQNRRIILTGSHKTAMHPGKRWLCGFSRRSMPLAQTSEMKYIMRDFN